MRGAMIQVDDQGGFTPRAAGEGVTRSSIGVTSVTAAEPLPNGNIDRTGPEMDNARHMQPTTRAIVRSTSADAPLANLLLT
jgi:hypothetical protein